MTKEEKQKIIEIKQIEKQKMKDEKLARKEEYLKRKQELKSIPREELKAQRREEKCKYMEEKFNRDYEAFKQNLTQEQIDLIEELGLGNLNEAVKRNKKLSKMKIVMSGIILTFGVLSLPITGEISANLVIAAGLPIVTACTSLGLPMLMKETSDIGDKTYQFAIRYYEEEILPLKKTDENSTKVTNEDEAKVEQTKKQEKLLLKQTQKIKFQKIKEKKLEEKQQMIERIEQKTEKKKQEKAEVKKQKLEKKKQTLLTRKQALKDKGKKADDEAVEEVENNNTSNL